MAKQVVCRRDAENKRLILQVLDDGVLLGGLAQPDLVNFGSVVIDLGDCVDGGADGTHDPAAAKHELKVREWDVCVDNGDGTTTRKKALFISSGPYNPGTTSGTTTLTVAIPAGVSNGTVAGLGLAFTPTKLTGLTVSGPSGGLVLVANHDEGSLSSAGFDYRLSGITDGAGYKLTFTLSE